MKKLVHMYKTPTPAFWRKVGDALLTISTSLATYSVADDWGKKVSIIIIVTGTLGKFITNLASEPMAPVVEQGKTE